MLHWHQISVKPFRSSSLPLSLCWGTGPVWSAKTWSSHLRCQGSSLCFCAIPRQQVQKQPTLQHMRLWSGARFAAEAAAISGFKRAFFFFFIPQLFMRCRLWLHLREKRADSGPFVYFSPNDGTCPEASFILPSRCPLHPLQAYLCFTSLFPQTKNTQT